MNLSPTTGRELADALHRSASFCALPPLEQERMREQAAKVFAYLEGAPPGMPQARASVLNEAATPGSGGSSDSTSGGADVIRRAGPAARNMLESLAFPDFVASLVQGTFQAMVDSSIQQMEAYSQLLASVSKTVDQFMDEHITDDMARDHLADNYGSVFEKQMTAQGPKLSVAPPAPPAGGAAPALPGFLQDLGFTDSGDIDEHAMNEAVIPQVRRTLAETRHQSLATMVMMGLNRIIIDEGEINAKLIFNVDASESTALTFDEQKPTNWTLAGTAGRNAFGASGLVVTTTNLNTQSDISVRAELTGEVRIKFRSDYFPLERFADSAAIQLINNYARPIPEKPAEESGADANAPLPQLEAPTVPGTNSPAATQSLVSASDDVWGDPDDGARS